jgi:hypothetical protein
MDWIGIIVAGLAGTLVIKCLYQFYLMEPCIGPPALSLSKGATIHDVARSNWY